mmetsp:Transcript_3328/g.8860  ORF Transcript_3328/g.8860 Transcript_3328/m.8860 type:complete len:204 (+) Transcript_3328:109-720(+)
MRCDQDSFSLWAFPSSVCSSELCVCVYVCQHVCGGEVEFFCSTLLSAERHRSCLMAMYDGSKCAGGTCHALLCPGLSLQILRCPERRSGCEEIIVGHLLMWIVKFVVAVVIITVVTVGLHAYFVCVHFMGALIHLDSILRASTISIIIVTFIIVNVHISDVTRKVMFAHIVADVIILLLSAAVRVNVIISGSVGCSGIKMITC